MAKRDYQALKQAIEDERIRLRANQSSYSGQHYRIVTAELARECDDDALIRGAAELKRHDPTEARVAAAILETEHRLRENASRSVTRRYSGWTLLIAIATLLAAIAAALFGYLSLNL